MTCSLDVEFRVEGLAFEVIVNINVEWEFNGNFKGGVELKLSMFCKVLHFQLDR